MLKGGIMPCLNTELFRILILYIPIETVSMDFSNKWLMGVATAPYIFLGMFLGAQYKFAVVLGCLFLSTIAYSNLVANADRTVQKQRFFMFVLFPIILFILAMYV